jgi:hypothetical protein
MKTIIKSIFFVVFASLVVANVYIFVSSIKLGERITFYESEIKKLHNANIELEQKVYKVNSLQYSASQAAALDFTKKVEPIYLDKLHFAQKE